MNFQSLVKEEPNITPIEIQNKLDGNMCRCTGYRPIFQAFKDYTEEQKFCSKFSGMGCTDIEDLGCSKKCQPNNIKNRAVKLKMEAVGSSEWSTVNTLNELYSLLDSNQGKKIKMVVGNTGYGVYPESYDLYIDINNIAELKTARASYQDGGAVIGSAVTINDMINLFNQWIQSGSFTTSQTKSWVELVEGFGRVATNQVRNVACWAGNLMLAKNHSSFVSDLMTLFLGIDATLTIGSSSGVITNMPMVKKKTKIFKIIKFLFFFIFTQTNQIKQNITERLYHV